MPRVRYSNPPLNEIVFGVQFPDVVFTNEVIFSFYDLVKDEFPVIFEDQKLPHVVEPWNGPQTMKLLGGIETRKQFVSNSNNKLIQIQSDRFWFNWRRGKEQYPHYESVFDDFKTNLNKLLEHSKIKISVNQYELAYVDHLEMDEFKPFDYQVGDAINLVNIKQSIKHLNLNFSIPLQELNGSLNVQVTTAVRREDKRELLTFQTTCRGFTDVGVDDWFSKAHQKLVDYFHQSTTEKIKEGWGENQIID